MQINLHEDWGATMANCHGFRNRGSRQPVSISSDPKAKTCCCILTLPCDLMWSLHRLVRQSSSRTLPLLPKIGQRELGETSENSDIRPPSSSGQDVTELGHPDRLAIPASASHGHDGAHEAPKLTPSAPWDFSGEEMERFPALRKRNFWCIQRHQARALHYDLRMQLDGATVSWAVPRGLLGMAKDGEAHRLAVQTTLHPISYTTFEGSDGRILPSGRRCGTMLWDIGTYTIDTPYLDTSDSEDERSRKRRRVETDGSEQEARFRQALSHTKGKSRVRSVHFTLQGGRKMIKHSYILVLPAGNSFSLSYSTNGELKKTWFLSLAKGISGYGWGSGGEEGDQYGRSVKSGRTLLEVCQGAKYRLSVWPGEKQRFGAWTDDLDEMDQRDKLSGSEARLKLRDDVRAGE